MIKVMDTVIIILLIIFVVLTGISIVEKHNQIKKLKKENDKLRKDLNNGNNIN